MAVVDRPLEGSVVDRHRSEPGPRPGVRCEPRRGGSALALIARSEQGLAETAALVAARDVACEVVVGDVCDDALAERVGHPGRGAPRAVDLLVNNAGVAHICAFADADVDDWWTFADGEPPGSDRLDEGRAARDAPTAAAGGSSTSRARGCGRPLPYVSSYGAAKAGLSQFTACVAPEVAACRRGRRRHRARRRSPT